MKEYTSTDYAKLKGCSRQYINRLCNLGRLNARRIGGVWIITAEKIVKKLRG